MDRPPGERVMDEVRRATDRLDAVGTHLADLTVAADVAVDAGRPLDGDDAEALADLAAALRSVAEDAANSATAVEALAMGHHVDHAGLRAPAGPWPPARLLLDRRPQSPTLGL